MTVRSHTARLTKIGPSARAQRALRKIGKSDRAPRAARLYKKSTLRSEIARSALYGKSTFSSRAAHPQIGDRAQRAVRKIDLQFASSAPYETSTLSSRTARLKKKWTGRSRAARFTKNRSSDRAQHAFIRKIDPQLGARAQRCAARLKKNGTVRSRAAHLTKNRSSDRAQHALRKIDPQLARSAPYEKLDRQIARSAPYENRPSARAQRVLIKIDPSHVTKVAHLYEIHALEHCRPRMHTLNITAWVTQHNNDTITLNRNPNVRKHAHTPECR